MRSVLKTKFLLLSFICLLTDGTMEKQAKKTLKHLKKEINNLINSNDSDKDSLFSLNSALLALANSKINDVELEKLINDVEKIKLNFEKRRKQSFYDECVEDVKKRNIKKAVIEFYHIDHTRIESFIEDIYENQTSFTSIVDFIEAVPSISLSLDLYIKFIKILNKSKHLSDEKGLILIRRLRDDVLLQYSALDSDKVASLEVLDELKNSVALWIGTKFKSGIGSQVAISGKPAQNDFLDRTFNYIGDDLKFIREITSYFLYEAYILVLYHHNFDFIKNMRPIIRIVMMSEIYNYMYLNFDVRHNVPLLMNLQNDILNLYHEESSKNKKIIENFIILPDIKFMFFKLIEHSLLNDYYDQELVDGITKEIVENDFDFFHQIMNSTLNKIDGRKPIIEILQLLSGNSLIEQSAAGYEVIHKKIRNSNIEKPGALLKLNSLVTDLLKNENLKYVSPKVVRIIKSIQFNLINVKRKVSNFALDTVYDNHYSDVNQNFWREIYASENFYNFASEAISNYASIILTKDMIRVCDFIASLPIIEERLVGFGILLDKRRETIQKWTSIHSNAEIIEDDFIFRIGQEYKKIHHHYENFSADFKVTYETNVHKLPSSLRFALFSEEVYIRSVNIEYVEFSSMNGTLYAAMTKRRGDRCKWNFESTKNPRVFKIKNSFYGKYIKNGNDGLVSDDVGSEWRLNITDGGVLLSTEDLMISPQRKFNKKILSVTPTVKIVWKIEEVFIDTI